MSTGYANHLRFGFLVEDEDSEEEEEETKKDESSTN